jgi:hypothetical protein
MRHSIRQLDRLGAQVAGLGETKAGLGDQVQIIERQGSLPLDCFWIYKRPDFFGLADG